MTRAAKQLSESIGIASACQALTVPRSSFYRAQQPPAPDQPKAEPSRLPPPRALSVAEQEQVRQVLNSERFQDQTPREVYATLLDEETYLCSWRTMYRILDEHQEVRERRNQLRHPAYVKPELIATAPNQLWSWDITKLRGSEKWQLFYLYVVLDVYSRYVPGWMIAECESAELAEELIATTCAKQGIVPGQLTVHADRGAAMTSKTMAQLLADLKVVESHSRPHVSNDNPYSEAQFKTMKYQPEYPARFGSVQDARQWAHAFFAWYNQAHHHSALGLLTPATVQHGQAPAVLAARQRVLAAAYATHPERFVKGPPVPSAVPTAVWINRPQPVLAFQPMMAH
jgi:putative transposase